MSTCGTGYSRVTGALCALALIAGLALSSCNGEDEVTGAAAEPAEAEALAGGAPATPDADALRVAMVDQELVDAAAADCAAQSLVRRLKPSELRAIVAGRSADSGRESPTGISGLERKIGAASLVCAAG